MWKYVSRRIRDTIERSVNHFDKRSTSGVVNSTISEDKSKHNQLGSLCHWYAPHKCWGSFQDRDTNSKRWNFDQLNRTWIGAITWSSALAIGWYTSQLIHLKFKSCHLKDCRKGCNSLNSLLAALNPYISYVNKNPIPVSKIDKIINTFAPTVHLISNEENNAKGRTGSYSSESSTNPDTSDNDLGHVLNSIENRLGLAAIENGQHQDGLNLLRSAANRNHAPALYNLGLCYEMGLGVTVNENTAMEFYRSAAALEHPGALYNLGIYYGQGRGGLPRDTDTATRLLKLAAVQGQQDAIDALKSLNTTAPKRVEEPPYPYTPILQNDNIVPTQTTLFVENVNYMHAVY